MGWRILSARDYRLDFGHSAHQYAPGFVFQKTAKSSPTINLPCLSRNNSGRLPALPLLRAHLKKQLP